MLEFFLMLYFSNNIRTVLLELTTDFCITVLRYRGVQMSFYMSTLLLSLEILIPYFPQKYSILNAEALPLWSFLITSVLSQFSIIFYKAFFLVKGHEVPIITLMHIAFIFQFLTIFMFLLLLSAHTQKIFIWGQPHFTHKNTSNSDIHPIYYLETFFIIFVRAYSEVNLLCDILRYNSIFSCTLMKILNISNTVLKISPKSQILCFSRYFESACCFTSKMLNQS